jgi:hypothetical protein
MATSSAASGVAPSHLAAAIATHQAAATASASRELDVGFVAAVGALAGTATGATTRPTLRSALRSLQPVQAPPLAPPRALLGPWTHPSMLAPP